jgi:hypothetical protein
MIVRLALRAMKFTGVFLLLSGWAIVLAAFGLLSQTPPAAAFALAGAGVEGFGMALLFRAHRAPREDRG